MTGLARGASPVAEAPEEVADAPLEGMDRELEMPAELPTTIELLSDEEVEATVSPTLDEAELESLHGLETASPTFRCVSRPLQCWLGNPSGPRLISSFL